MIRFPLAVWGLIAANVVFFCQELLVPSPELFINSFALIPYDLSRNITLPPPSPPFPGFTLITSQFLHDGILHIAANMLFLFVFGPEVECLTGTLRFIVFYVLCGVFAGIAQYSIFPMSHLPSIGASGAIAAVLGAYILQFPTNRVRASVIALWAVAQCIHGFGALSSHVLSEQGGRIAYFAHIGGFLSGVFLIRFFATRTPEGKRRIRCA
jgi:membrane associated rhomboid family serine protease